MPSKKYNKKVNPIKEPHFLNNITDLMEKSDKYYMARFLMNYTPSSFFTT